VGPAGNSGRRYAII